MPADDEYGRFRREVSAALHAARGMSSDSRNLVFEDLLSRLSISTPNVGRIATDLIALYGEPAASAAAERIRLVAGPYAGASLESGDQPRDVDMLILTVKQPELEACQLAFGIKAADEGAILPGDQMRVWSGDIQGKSFALVNVGVAGNVRAALTVLDLSKYYRPRLALLIGMAGAVQKANVGDVVIPRHVYDYDYARVTKWGTDDLSLPHEASADLSAYLADGVRLTEWRVKFQDELPLLYERFTGRDEMPPAHPDVSKFVLRTEPLMSGGKLFEAGKVVAKARAFEVNKEIVGVEMEGAGFATACTRLGWRWRIVRGIADLSNARRPKYNQRLATYGAALYVRTHFPPLSFFQ
jgi:nucleoside phosphorylase